MSNSNNFIGLELLRFVCSLSVLIWHYQHFGFSGDYKNFLIEQQPFYGWISLFYKYGCYSVQLFWCISGFIFYWKYSEKIANQFVTNRDFWVRRFSRLYPLHLITLILIVILQYFYYFKNGLFFVYEKNDFKHFVIQLWMASGWNINNISSFNGPVWSVSIEILFYCLFFLVCRFISAKAMTNMALIIIALVLGKFLGQSNLFLLCMLCFNLGGLVFFFNKAFMKLSKRTITATQIVSLAVLIFVCIKCYLVPNPYFFLTRAFPIIVFLSLQIKTNEKLGSIFKNLGNLTYSSYLLHFPIQLLVAVFFSLIGTEIPYKSPELFIVFVIGTLLLSYYCFHYIEIPIQNYIRNKEKIKWNLDQ